jgi:hypothetical protein
MGVEQNTLNSPAHGIILGMTTMPAVKPGEPICNIATLTPKQLERYRSKLNKAKADPHSQAQTDLATSMDVVDA